MTAIAHFVAITCYIGAAALAATPFARPVGAPVRGVVALLAAGVLAHGLGLVEYAHRVGQLPLTGLGPSLSFAGLVLAATLLIVELAARDVSLTLVAAPLAAVPTTCANIIGLIPGVEVEGARGAWLVCGAPSDGADALAHAIRALADDSPIARRVAADVVDAVAWREVLRAEPAPASVVFVAPRETPGLAAQRRGLVALTALVQACSELPSLPRIVVVTANAQAATDDDMPDPGAALYVGFGRVLCREHPELQARIVDIAATDAGWAAACAAELRAGDGDDQVALRGGRRLVGRLVRGEAADAGEHRPRAWATPAQPFQLRAPTPGVLDAVEYRPLCRRAPAAGEIEIEVTAAALNFIDVMKAMGTYPGADGRGLLGGECAGRVVAVGTGVRGFAAGDRVVACAFGSFASHVTVRADHAQRIPEGMDDAAAAGLPLVATTAWYALHDLAQLAPGESVLIHAATGGLGLAAIQVARRLGARVLATAGTAQKRSLLAALGVTDVFDSRDLSWADGVRAATAGRGVDVVLNSLTGAAIPLGLDVLAEDGRFIEVGKQDIYGGRKLPLAAFQKGIRFAAVDLAGLMQRRPERFARALSAAWDQVCAGAIAPLPTMPILSFIGARSICPRPPPKTAAGGTETLR